MPNISALAIYADDATLVSGGTIDNTEHNTHRTSVRDAIADLYDIVSDLENNYSSATEPDDKPHGKIRHNSSLNVMQWRPDDTQWFSLVDENSLQSVYNKTFSAPVFTDSISTSTNSLEWLLQDNSALSLTFSSTSQSGLLSFGTTTGSESVSVGVDFSVLGDVSFSSSLSVSDFITFDPVSYEANFSGSVEAEGFYIGANEVLNDTTLGSSVVNSSLTSVGALSSGSITSSFGSIDIGSSSISGGNSTFSRLDIKSAAHPPLNWYEGSERRFFMTYDTTNNIMDIYASEVGSKIKFYSNQNLTMTLDENQDVHFQSSLSVSDFITFDSDNYQAYFNGFLGLGVSSPSELLHIGVSTGSASIRYSVSDADDFISRNNGNDTFSIAHPSNGDLLSVSSTGNVGIQNSLPATTLEIGDVLSINADNYIINNRSVFNTQSGNGSLFRDYYLIGGDSSTIRRNDFAVYKRTISNNSSGSTHTLVTVSDGGDGGSIFAATIFVTVGDNIGTSYFVGGALSQGGSRSISSLSSIYNTGTGTPTISWSGNQLQITTVGSYNMTMVKIECTCRQGNYDVSAEANF